MTEFDNSLNSIYFAIADFQRSINETDRDENSKYKLLSLSHLEKEIANYILEFNKLSLAADVHQHFSKELEECQREVNQRILHVLNASLTKSKRESPTELNEAQSISAVIPKSNEPIRYKKGEVRTKDLVPTEGERIGRGLSGSAYIHANDPSLVVIKKTKSMEKQFALGKLIDHPCIARTKELFIKEKDGIEINKLVMEKVEGRTLGSYLYGEKLSNEVAKQLIIDLKDTINYLHKNKISAGDLNEGNLFATPDGHLKIIDLDAWEEKKDNTQLTNHLMVAAVEVLGWIVRSTTIDHSEQRDEKINSVVFPKEIFNGELEMAVDTNLFTLAIKIVRNPNIFGCNEMDEQQSLELINRYFDHAIANFDKAAE